MLGINFYDQLTYGCITCGVPVTSHPYDTTCRGDGWTYVDGPPELLTYALLLDEVRADWFAVEEGLVADANAT